MPILARKRKQRHQQRRALHQRKKRKEKLLHLLRNLVPRRCLFREQWSKEKERLNLDVSHFSCLQIKVYLTWKIFSAYLKGLSKYTRMAFFVFLWNIFFRFRDIDKFVICKLHVDQWCLWISLKRKKIFRKEKRYSSVFRKAFQISRKYFSCHIHFKLFGLPCLAEVNI